MLNNETPPRVKRIETDRDDVFAFEVTGEIVAADIENLYGLIEGASLLHELIDIIVIVHDYDGLDWSTLFRGETYSGKAEAFKHIRRIALVGAEGWIRTGIAVAKPFTSIEIKEFDLDKADEAWAWIGASPLPV